MRVAGSGSCASFGRVLRGPFGYRARVAVACLLLPAALVVASCGGSSDDDGGTVPAASATVVVKDMPGYGKVLTTGEGRALYVLTSDPEGGSKCVDADCTKDWKPLVADGEPKGSDGIKTSMLGTFKRGDGEEQVLYNQRALYTYGGEDLAGAGIKALGGTWYLVDPDGDPVETTAVGGY